MSENSGEFYPQPTNENASPISTVAFPMPDRANNFPDGKPQNGEDQHKLDKTKDFAKLQATEANRVLGELRSPDFPGTADAWKNVYEEVTNWRYNLAVASSGHQFAAGCTPKPCNVAKRSCGKWQ